MKTITCDRCGTTQPVDSNRTVASFRFACEEAMPTGAGYQPFVQSDLCETCAENVRAFINKRLPQVTR